MAHLTDMEELLATVSSNEVRDYMSEAMNCYMSNAYRGCIVLSYIALFDDLLAKLSELSKVNKSAKTIYIDANRKKIDQEVFESFLIDQLGSNNLLTGLDVAFLNTLRTLRNKSAHPSGHKPSPEEARFIYFEVINRFLSQPILSTTQLVDELIERLKNKNFFPTSQISDIQEVVKEEIKSLHNEAYPPLVLKLTNETISSNSDISKNSGFFLTGLASLDHGDLNSYIQKKIIEDKSDNADYHQLILRLISSNGKLFIGLNKTSISRFKKIFFERIEKVKVTIRETNFSHPISVFSSLCEVLEEDKLIENFEDEIKELFNRKPYSNYLISSISIFTKVKKIYIDLLKVKAASNTFDIANRFADSLEDIDKSLAKISSPMDAFEIIVAVLKAADWNAFSSQALKKTKFEKAPKIRKKAITYMNANKRKTKTYLKDELHLDITADKFVEVYLKKEE